MGKQRHDIGVRKRLARIEEGWRPDAPSARRRRETQRREAEREAFLERWSA